LRSSPFRAIGLSPDFVGACFIQNSRTNKTLRESTQRALPDHFSFTSTLPVQVDRCLATSSDDLRDVLFGFSGFSRLQDATSPRFIDTAE
jgi:hypothetical protein